jgi:hypothetical protein
VGVRCGGWNAMQVVYTCMSCNLKERITTFSFFDLVFVVCHASAAHHVVHFPDFLATDLAVDSAGIASRVVAAD